MIHEANEEQYFKGHAEPGLQVASNPTGTAAVSTVRLDFCETGRGRISPGEGVVGMSWAFFVAGARSVVVSQWRVNSTSTSQLMKNFYRALGMQENLNTRSKAQAIRGASLRLLKDRRYRHPFYWAGFVLVSSN